VAECTVQLLQGMGQMPTWCTRELPDILVGLDDKMKHVVQLLTADQHSSSHVVLLHGMGGIGKTTLARAVFNELHARNRMLRCCFVELDPDTTGARLVEKQCQMLNCLSDKHVSALDGTEKGRQELLRVLHDRKVLLVVDNVWGDHLEFLLPSTIMQVLGPGSMVLVTSRRQDAARHLVGRQGVQEVEMAFLSRQQSLELFCKYAFPAAASQCGGWADLVGLKWLKKVEALLDRCGGLPMALEVVGRRFADSSNKDEFLESLAATLADVYGDQKAGRYSQKPSII
jgi:hypothetical protein